MPTILVTGSNGQLGSEIKNISTNYKFKFLFTDVDDLDISNYSEIQQFIENKKIDFIVNCAAYTAVDKAETEKELAYLVNSNAVENLAKISKSHNIKLIHVSTDYVFDGKSCLPYKEDDITNPIGYYGFSKLEGEKKIQQHDCESIIIRTSWLYSSFGNNFLKTIIKHSTVKNELNVVFDQVGTPTYAADLAKAILEIIKSDIFIKGIYHYSNEGVCSWYDFAYEIVKLTNSKCLINPIESKDFPTPTKRPNYSVLNKSKIKSTFHVKIPNWKESLNNCLNEIKKAQ